MSRIYSNIDYLVKQIEAGFVLWTIAADTNKQVLNFNDEPIPAEESADLFREACQNLQGVVYVNLKHPENNKSATKKQIGVYLNLSPERSSSGMNGTGSDPMSTQGGQTLFQMLMLQMQETQTAKMELMRLQIKQEFSEREKAPDLQSLAMKKEMLEIVKGFISPNTAAPRKIAGPPEERGTDNDQVKEKKARTVQALRDLGDVEDLDKKLEKLARLKKDNPEMFKSIISGLDTL